MQTRLQQICSVAILLLGVGQRMRIGFALLQTPSKRMRMCTLNFT